MYLTKEQKLVLRYGVEKLSKIVVIKKGLSGEYNAISNYALNEINTLTKANNDLGEKNLTNELPDIDDINEEFERLSKVIKEHPELSDKFEEIVELLKYSKKLECQFVIHAKGDYQSYFDLIANTYDLTLKKIIRLQAALNMPINLKYVDIIDELFDEMYMSVVNNHYKDPYVKTI